MASSDINFNGEKMTKLYFSVLSMDRISNFQFNYRDIKRLEIYTRGINDYFLIAEENKIERYSETRCIACTSVVLFTHGK